MPRALPLQLVDPPALVRVRDVDGEPRRALLIAHRAGRSYLQVHRAPGDNVLRWLPSDDVQPARPAVPSPPPPAVGKPGDVGAIAP